MKQNFASKLTIKLVALPGFSAPAFPYHRNKALPRRNMGIRRETSHVCTNYRNNCLRIFVPRPVASLIVLTINISLISYFLSYSPINIFSAISSSLIGGLRYSSGKDSIWPSERL